MKNMKILFLALLSLVVLSSCEKDKTPDVQEGNAIVEFKETAKTVTEAEKSVSIAVIVAAETAPTEWPITFDITVEPTDVGVVIAKSINLEITEADKSVNMVITLNLENETFEENRVYTFTIGNIRGKGFTLNPDKKSFVLTVTNDDVLPAPSSITANSFIVMPSGAVTIPVNNVNIFWGIGGDGAIATDMGAEWSEPNLEAPAVTANLIKDDTYVAEVIWSDIAEGVNVTFAKAATHFTVSNIPATSGNIVVGVKAASAVAADPYLWSWHLWVTDFDPNANAATLPNGEIVMDRNLGATNATPSDVASLGLLYQWGRKDPFPGASSINEDIVRTTVPTMPNAVEGGVGTLLSVTGQPSVFYGADSGNYDAINTGHLTGDNGMNRWGGAASHTSEDPFKNTKTIYDPCPEGWRMPWGENWSGFTNSEWEKETSELKLHTDGWDNKRGRVYTNEGKTIWFPAAGYRSNDNGNLGNVGTNGFGWSGSAYGAEYGYNLVFSNKIVWPNIDNYRSFGYSVRPVKDTP